jgi:hypothetical protein
MTVCIHCDEEVKETDRIHVYADARPVHEECFLRQIIGSVGHQLHTCSCFILGSTVGDPEGMTKREAAKVAVSIWRRNNERTTTGQSERSH